MHRNIALLTIAGLAAAASAQTTLFTETFEDTLGYTTSTAEFSDGAGDFWFNTASGMTYGTFVEYNGADGAFFAGMDIDGEGASLPVVQTFDAFNIGGYTGFSFSVDLAEDDAGGDEDWDEADFVRFEYSVDGGSWNTLLEVYGDEFTSSGGPFNGKPFVNGVEVTSDFATFSSDALAGISGDSLQIRAVWSLDAGDEDLAIDNLTVTAIPTPGALALLSGSGLIALRRRR